MVTLLLTRGSVRAQDASAPEKLAKDLSELSFEELVDLSIDSVYAASAYAQKITEAPASVTIVTGDDIDALRLPHARGRPAQRARLLRHQRPQLQLSRRARLLQARDYNARILLLIDGHRLNDNVFGSALLGTEFPLDLDLIERIEIIRGPSSSLYGTSAFFARDQRHHQEGRGHRRLRRRRHARQLRQPVAAASASARAFANGAQVLLSGLGLRERRPARSSTSRSSTRPRPTTASPRRRRRRIHALPRQVSAPAASRWQALHGSRDKTVPTASFGTVFNDPRSGTVETQQFVDAQYERTLASALARRRARLLRPLRLRRHLRLRSWRRAGRRAGLRPEPRLRPRQPVGRRSQAAPAAGAAPHAGRGFGVPPQLPAGPVQLRRQSLPPVPRRPRSSTNWAVYVQDEIKLHERAARERRPPPRPVRHVRRHDQPACRAHLHARRARTTVKLLYGQAFRAPNAYELFWRQDDVAKPNPVLRPETNSTSEFVLEQLLSSAVRVGVTALPLPRRRSDQPADRPARRPARLQQRRSHRRARAGARSRGQVVALA